MRKAVQSILNKMTKEKFDILRYEQFLLYNIQIITASHSANQSLDQSNTARGVCTSEHVKPKQPFCKQ
jgi:ribosomal protein S12